MSDSTRQRALINKLVEAKGSISIYKAMRSVGYSHTYARASTKVTKSKSFQELLEELLPDDALLRVHAQLLGSKKIEHMEFPADMLDGDIALLVEGIGGTLREIRIGKSVKRAYWWSNNEKSQLPALALAYKIKGRLVPSEPAAAPIGYATFVQNNQLDPNTPSARQLVDASLATLMDLTKRKSPTDLGG